MNNIVTVVIGCLIALGIRDFIAALVDIFLAVRKTKNAYKIRDLSKKE